MIVMTGYDCLLQRIYRAMCFAGKCFNASRKAAYGILPGVLLLCLMQPAFAQPARDSFEHWQQEYKREFLSDARAPLTAEDTGGIRFYPFNPKLVFARARVKISKNQKPFLIATHSGKAKRVRQYAVISCMAPKGFPASLRRHRFDLRVYQILAAGSDSARDDGLFVPFYDATNGSTTYGGGRYMDLHISDIRDGRLMLDFNRAYNPWCAYKEGYNCPIPPEENRLHIAIEAGEKMYVK
jgi:uncharacterized protein (DUF1684 family)